MGIKSEKTWYAECDKCGFSCQWSEYKEEILIENIEKMGWHKSGKCWYCNRCYEEKA